MIELEFTVQINSDVQSALKVIFHQSFERSTLQQSNHHLTYIVTEQYTLRT